MTVAANIKRILLSLVIVLLISTQSLATVTSEVSRKNYVGNGVLTTYPFTWEIYVKTDLKVYVSDVLQAVDIDYTIAADSIGVEDGGNVVFDVGSIPALLAPISIVLDLPLTQLTDYIEGGKFPAETHERALDRLIKIAQEFDETLKRVPKLPTPSLLDLDMPAPTADNYIGWNAAADNLENKALPVATTATQYDVDALISYGGGTSYTDETIQAACTAIGTVDLTTLLIRPGDWVIDADLDLSAYANITFDIAPGADLQVSVGQTLTFYSPENIIASLRQQIVSGAGAVAFSEPGTSFVHWTGALGDGATDDSTAIQAAIDALPAGSTLVIPQAATYYKITATQLSEALTVATQINIVLDGELRATSHTNQANPPFIMNVTADDVVIKGTGTFRGNGTYVNDEADGTHRAGLLRVTGESINISGVTFKNQQSVGVFLHSGDNHNIHDSKFTGGPVYGGAMAGGDNKNFYIYMYNNNNKTIISNNKFYMDSGSGAAINGIGNYYGTTQGLDISHNNFYNIHEHCLYMYVDHSNFIGNIVRYTQVVGEQVGSAFVLSGAHNVITNNNIYNATKGGISVRYARACVISNNVLRGVGFVGINIAELAATATGEDYNIIEGNTLIAAATGTIYEGIRYYVDEFTLHISYGPKIINNALVGWGDTSAANLPAISLAVENATYPIYNANISGNTIQGSNGHGIYLNNVHKVQIKNNIVFNNPKVNFIFIYCAITTGLKVEGNSVEDYQGATTLLSFLAHTGDTADVWMVNNECFGASQTNPYAHNTARNVLGRGNRTSRTDNLVGVITLDADAATTVTNANMVDPTLTDAIGFVLLTPLNASAAVLVGSAKSPYVSVITAGTSFVIASPGNAAGTEVFAYEIVQ